MRLLRTGGVTVGRRLPGISRLIRIIGNLRQSQAGQAEELAQQASALAGHAGELSRQCREVAVQGERIEALHRQLLTSNDSIRHLTRLLANTAAVAGPDHAGIKISVIMPVYNRISMAGTAIGSVLAQQGVAFELIVIDDGSTDGFGMATIPALTAPEIRLLRAPHAGACVARNIGIAAASGNVIAYLDSDNIMYPGYLRALAAAYAGAPAADCAYAAMLWDDGAVRVHLRHDEFSWPELLAQRMSLDINCFSHRAETAARFGGFDETLTKHGDFDLALRYTRDQAPLRVDAVAAHYYAGDKFSRLSLAAPSGPNFARILAKHHVQPVATLKILVYCSDYPQLSESYVDTEIAFMVARGCRLEVFQRMAPGAPGVALVPVHTAGLARVIADFQPDVIHCHWLPMAAEVAALAAAHGIPVTVRGHGFEFSPESLASCAALAVVKSIYLFPHLARLAPAATATGKVKPVTSCFDKSRFYPRVGQNRRLVLRAAACLDSKGIETFIRVAARCPNHRFVLAMARIAVLPQLPSHFTALNALLGNPVDIRMDVGIAEMAALTGEAGIYLHTFGFKQPFGMPVSVAEAMACGAALLLRDCAAARSYAGNHAFYYNTEDEVIAYINATLEWPEQEWAARAKANADFAYATYVDHKVLGPILRDWHQLNPKNYILTP